MKYDDNISWSETKLTLLSWKLFDWNRTGAWMKWFRVFAAQLHKVSLANTDVEKILLRLFSSSQKAPTLQNGQTHSNNSSAVSGLGTQSVNIQLFSPSVMWSDGDTNISEIRAEQISHLESSACIYFYLGCTQNKKKAVFCLRKNSFSCLLSVRNIISLSYDEQVCLMRATFQEIFLPSSDWS